MEIPQYFEGLSLCLNLCHPMIGEDHDPLALGVRADLRRVLPQVCAVSRGRTGRRGPEQIGIV